MELSLKNMEEMVLYSNATLEKVMKSLVNESSNAVLCATFDDAVLLLDHKEGQFYLADYEFDQKKATFKFENFEPISLTKTTSDFKDAVRNFFENEDVASEEVLEAYRNTLVGQESFISELVTESMTSKDFSNVIDFSEVKNEDEDIVREKFFESYKERLSTHPLSSIKYFNWKNPVSVSLVETERPRDLESKMASLANDLWKKEEFKKDFNEAATTFVEDVEEGAEKFKVLMEANPGIFYLNDTERKTLFGKTIIASAKLRENRTDILKGLDLLFEKFDIADLRESLEEEGKLLPAQLTKGQEGDAAKDLEGEEGEPEENDTAPEVTKDEVGKLVTALEKLKAKAEKMEDDKAAKVAEKIDAIISDLEGSAETGGDAKAVKEAVEILSL
jgi:hypothetical protein